jgi:uncharacterized damage-inducible protein DinB
MDVSSLLLEFYRRIPPLARRAVEGAELDQLLATPAPQANSIAWLIWHLARVQDHHVAELLGEDQVWIDGWAARFGLESDQSNTGYGHDAEEMAAVRPQEPEVLLDYLEAVDRRTQTWLAEVTAADLDRVVDRRWDPAVTLGVRLVSVADDCLQHAGQAAYVRGLLGD